MAGPPPNCPVITAARPEPAVSPEAPRRAVLPTLADEERFKAAHHLEPPCLKAVELEPGFAPARSRLSELGQES